jgi:UDP-N-acetylmuramoyl-L-alanyl-D-glutamate--2,6-diaminopimelate ligase
VAGDVFFCLPGAKSHGASFAQQAVSQGAVAIVTDLEGSKIIGQLDIPVLLVKNPRASASLASKYVFGNAKEKMPRIYGVTGTNGKTSTVHFLYAILHQLGLSAGLSSSVERRIGLESHPARLTSPEASESHGLLARMREKNVSDVAWEVSAHALSHHRVEEIFFDVVGFTNLSHDHLDEFGTMEEYLRVKTLLFSSSRAGRGVVCLDSDYGQQFLEASQIPCLTVTLREDIQANWKVVATDQGASHTSFDLLGPSGEKISSSVPIIGSYMASNAAVAILMAIQAGHDWQQLATVLKDGIGAKVAGRAEDVSSGNGPRVYVDFGHTPDSIEKTIQAIRDITKGKLVVVVGLGGDRDIEKRSVIGGICAIAADAVIVTDNNPRFEEPSEIRRMIFEGALAKNPTGDIRNIEGSERAIRIAISMVREGDSVIWFGPGHQQYREIKGERFAYSGRAEARAALKEAGWA